MHRVNHSRATGTGNAVVVRLSYATQSGNIVLEEEVLSKVGNTLLGDDKVGLDGDDGVAHGLDLLLLNLQHTVPVLLLGDLNGRLRLALLVLQRAVQQHNARVLYPSPHLGVCNVLVHHDTVQHARIFNLAAGHFLHTCVTLDVHLLLSTASIVAHCAHSREGQIAHEVAPSRGELAADRRANKLSHLFCVVDVHGNGDLLDDRERIGERALVCLDNHDGVDLAIELW